MEVDEVKSFIESLNSAMGTKDGGFLKTLLKNKFVIGSAVIAGGVTLFNAVKYITVQGIASSLLPSGLFNVSIGGIPIGSVTFKLLGFTIAGTLIAEAFKVVREIREKKSSVSDILFKEGVSLIIMIFSFYLLGKLGINLISAVSSF